MHAAPSIFQPIRRAYVAFRDAVDAFWHGVLDFRDETATNQEPADPRVWHKWQLGWPVKTIEGEVTTYVWRRQLEDGKFEYRRRDMTPEEAEERAEL
jgi:hypothetical protein